MARPEEKTVLVIDDEPDIVVYLSTTLEDAGFRVLTAGDGQEALEIMASETPDFISLDLVMPRKSGIRFFRELRRNRAWSRIPVMVVTGHGRDERGETDLGEILNSRTLSGPGLYLEKPVKPDDFVRAVASALDVELDPNDWLDPDREEHRQEAQELLGQLKGEELERMLKILRRGSDGAK
jgi:CheY-like chemotaxis protein